MSNDADALEPSLQLPQSNLTIEGASLVRRDGKRRIIAQHRFDQIEDMSVGERWQPAVILVTVFCFALAGLARWYIPWPGWGWAAALTLVGCGLFVLLMLKVSVLVVKTGGLTVKYDLNGIPEENMGFAATAIALWDKARGLPSAVRGRENLEQDQS